MSWIAWVAIATPAYFVGFIIAGTIEQRVCTARFGGHRHCHHPFKTPFPLFWPLTIALGIPFAFVALPFKGSVIASQWLAERETLAERRDRLDVERDKRVAEQARTIARLEREVGIR